MQESRTTPHRIGSLTVALTLLAAAAIPSLVSAETRSEAEPFPARQEDEEKEEKARQEKDKKKRGRVVEATLVEPEPAEKEEAETEPAAESEAAAERREERAGEAAPEDAPGPAAAAHAAEPTAAEAESSSAATDVPGRDVPVFRERVEVTEVLLDVLVTDNKGNVVRGLGEDDFVVEEEGRPVKITSVTFYGTPEELRASGETPGAERSDRYFLLLFHDRARDAPILRGALIDAGRWARRWVEEELLPNDQVAVLGYDVRLKVYSDFTRDEETLLGAIAKAAAGRKEPDRRLGREREPLRPAADSPSLLLNLPAGKDLRRETAVFQEALELLGRAAEGIVGRKNLLLFSIGYGDTTFGSLVDGVWRPDTRYYPEMKRSLNGGNVAVYGVDLLGNQRRGPAGPGLSSSLSSIASDTGGLYYEVFTNFLNPLREVAEDNQGYYLLSYRSEYPRGTTGYREVEVRTVNEKLRLRHREGYRYGEPNSAERR